jgi:hypothetical protein
MKILPKTGQGWLSFLSLPFKAFVLASSFIYPIWLHAMKPVKAGTFSGYDYITIDPDKLPFSFELIVTGYFLTFLVLLIIATVQGFTKNRRGAIWSSVFAVVALCLAVSGAFHPVYK